MGIEAEGSHGVFAECPQCHLTIQHGFQVCQHCGHCVSAEQQAALRKLLGQNIFVFSLVSFSLLAIIFYMMNYYFTG